MIANAIIWYEKAAQLNNAEALRKLGDIYSSVDYVGRDYQKALAYYEKASRLGDHEAAQKRNSLLRRMENKSNINVAFKAKRSILDDPSSFVTIIGIVFMIGFIAMLCSIVINIMKHN